MNNENLRMYDNSCLKFGALGSKLQLFAWLKTCKKRINFACLPFGFFLSNFYIYRVVFLPTKNN